MPKKVGLNVTPDLIREVQELRKHFSWSRTAKEVGTTTFLLKKYVAPHLNKKDFKDFTRSGAKDTALKHPYEDARKKIEFYRSLNNSITEISKLTGISITNIKTYYTEAVEMGLLKGRNVALSKVFEKVKKGDLAAIKYYLNICHGLTEQNNIDLTSGGKQLPQPKISIVIDSNEESGRIIELSEFTRQQSIGAKATEAAPQARDSVLIESN